MMEIPKEPPKSEVKEQKKELPPPPKRPKVKKPWTKKKKITVIVVVVIILLPFIILGILYNLPATVERVEIIIPGTQTTDDEGNTVYMGKMVEDGKLKLPLTIDIKTSSLSTAKGDAKYTIKYNGTETAYGKFEVKDNFGGKNISYSDFVIGNGIYDISVSFEGKSADVKYKVDSVIEDAIITIKPEPYIPERGKDIMLKVRLEFLSSQKKIGDHGIPYGDMILIPKGFFITINFDLKYEGESFQQFNENIDTSAYEKTFDYMPNKGGKGSGNYTLDLIINNEHTKSGKEFNSLKRSNTTNINTPPMAVLRAYHVDEDNTEIKDNDDVNRGIDREATIDFKGSESIDDGKIIEYRWTIMKFEKEQPPKYVVKNQSTGKNSKFTYTFNDPGDYECMLTVVDDYGEESYPMEPIKTPYTPGSKIFFHIK